MERIHGPFTQLELEQYLGGPFQASPLVIVQKPGSPKSRLVRDFSCDFDRSVPSINDLILSFVPPTPARTYWTKFNELKKLVWNAPPGSMAMVIDAKEAFRQGPIIWHQRRFCIIEFCERFYVDRCLPMGLTVATDLFGSLIDVYRLYTEELFSALKLVTTNQVDDILHLVQVWAMAKEDIRAAFLAVCEELGLVIADKEGGIVEFTSTPPFLGFVLDFGVRRSISLKREKQIKYRDRVQAFVKNNCKANLEELESITGYLAHAALVTTTGRAHLVSLYAWAASFEGNYFKSNYPRDPRIRSDLEWWLELLSRDEPVTLFLHGDYELDTTNIVTDACLEGIGIIVGREWQYWRCRPGWNDDASANIDWAEAIGVELALKAHFDANPLLRRRTIRVWCDNKGVCDGWLKVKHANKNVNATFVRIDKLLEGRECDLEMPWISTHDNDSDAISRGIFPLPGSGLTRIQNSPLDLSAELLKVVFE